MEDWWGAMSQIEHVYWIIAIVFSVILLIVFVLTLFGGDTDMDGVDAEIEGDTGIGFQFISFKSVVGFFTVFGWTGITCINAGVSNWMSVLIALIAGLIMMFVIAWLFYIMMKQTESGTLLISNSVGKVGEVYLTVGANRSKIGKIQIKVQGSLRELEAITDNDEDLVQGNVIRVKEVITGELLLIEKLN